ncbi:hypothetical protein BH10BDE1_BH10BDE1_28560 [soil metagenome]
MTALSLDDVVALNALIVTAIGLTFVLSKKDKGSTTLNLSGPKRETAMDELAARKNQNRENANSKSQKSMSISRGGGTYGATALKRLEENETETAAYQGRQLNIFFNWNGHTWDAYEVLGIPAGASRETVVGAFHAARNQSPDSTPFLQAATDAILKRK